MRFDRKQMGAAFRQLREETGKKGKDFAPLLNSSKLSKFEKGEAALSYEEMCFAAKVLGLELSDFDYLLAGKSVYARYGEIFHGIRVQRGYKDNFFENFGVSPFRLKLFEEGRIDLGYTLFDEMLQAIHVPEADYTHWLNGGKDDYFIDYIKKAEAYYLKSDVEKLKAYEGEVLEVLDNVSYDKMLAEEELKNSPEKIDDSMLENLTKEYTDLRILALGIKSCYTALSEEEIEETSDFFMGIDYWTEFGIAMFAIIVKNLSFDLIRVVLLEFIKHRDLFEDNYFYRRRIMQAAVETSLHFCTIGQIEAARNVLQLSKSFLKNTDSYASCSYKFAHGYCQYCRGNVAGAEMMKTAIAFFGFVNETALQEKCQIFYDEHVNR